MADVTAQEIRSSLLPSDPFEIALAKLVGHPGGAHTEPTVVQATDHYGNLSRFLIQTVKWAEGNTVFITQVNTNGRPAINMMLPPEAMAVIARQQDSVTKQVRRRHGQRLAEQQKANGVRPVFTKAMRAKALATRKAKAAARQARRARKAVA